MFSIKLLAWKKPVSLKVYFTTVPACAWVAVIFQITLSLTMSAGLPRKYSVTVSNGPLGASLRGSLINNSTVSVKDVLYTASSTTQKITCDKDCYLVGKFGVANYTRHDIASYSFYVASGYLKHYNSSGVLIETLATVSNFTGEIDVQNGVVVDSSKAGYASSFFTSVSKGDYLELNFTGEGGNSVCQSQIQGYWIYND